MADYKIVKVRPEHIEKGIEKYGGVRDKYLNSLLLHADLQYTAYRFEDNRILLVLPNNLAAFLYENEDHFFYLLNLE